MQEIKRFNILIKPDAFMRKKLKDILVFLEQNGIYITHFNLIMPNSTLLDYMYQEQFNWEYDFYTHNRDLFSLGPSLSLICEVDSKIKLNKNFLKKIKGHSLAFKNAAYNSVRGKFDVLDRCLNLIHIADTYADNVKEINCIYQLKNSENFVYEGFRYKLSSDLVYSEVIGLLGNTGEYSAQTVTEILTKRIIHRYCSCLNYAIDLLAKEKISELSQLVMDYSLDFEKLKNSIKKYGNEYLTPHFIQMITMSTELQNIISSTEVERKIRFFDYFWALCDKSMIYISPQEKYIITSDALYYSVNRH